MRKIRLRAAALMSARPRLRSAPSGRLVAFRKGRLVLGQGAMVKAGALPQVSAASEGMPARAEVIGAKRDPASGASLRDKLPASSASPPSSRIKRHIPAGQAESRRLAHVS